MLSDNGTVTRPVTFPNELQRLIFEIAARSDCATATQLALVAWHVRNWIESILYECVIVRSQRHAAALLDTISTKPRAFFDPLIKSLAIGDSVTLQQSKAILAACSQNVESVAVWADSRNPTMFLPFIRSQSIRHLSLKSQHYSELSFPPTLLSSLTHLMILDGPYSWFQMREAARHARNKGDGPECHTATSTNAQFRSLTHFGVCSQNWGSTQSILKVAENLRYFVVIVPPKNKAAAIIAQRIREIGDRRMVIIEYEQTIANWESAVRGSTDSVWERAETLAREGYFAERGDVRKWDL